MKKFLSLRMPKGYSFYLHLSMILLSVFGSIMVVSASSNRNVTVGSLASGLVKQMGFFVLGYILMVWCAKFATMKKIKPWIFPLLILMGILLIIPLAFPPVAGAQAWIRIPGFPLTLQPSEFAKVLVILTMALYLGDIKSTRATTMQIIKIPVFSALIFTIIIVFLQSDLGSGVILFAIAWLLFMIPSHPKLSGVQLGGLVLTGLGIVAIIWLFTPSGMHFIEKLPLASYQISRFTDMFNPFINRHGSSFQLFNSLIAFVKGNWWGIGLGKSVQKLGYLPVANSDYILAIIVEELGIFAFVFILLGYIVMISVLFKYALLYKNEQGKMVLFGTALFLFFHFVLNVGGVSALIPLTGVPLLLISSGGSSQLAIMIALGFSQGMIARYSKEVKTYETHRR